MTTPSKKHLGDISHAHKGFLLSELKTSAKYVNDLAVGFDRYCNRRLDELTDKKNIKGKYHLTILLEVVFGFAEHQTKATYGLGYKLPLTSFNKEAITDKTVGIAEARNKIDLIHWYAPHFTLSIQQQGKLSKQYLTKTPAELR